MRIASSQQHPDYHPISAKLSVTLNGERLRDCLFADEEAGIVRRYKRDAHGSFIYTEYEVVSEVLKGDVVIGVNMDNMDGYDAGAYLLMLRDLRFEFKRNQEALKLTETTIAV